MYIMMNLLLIGNLFVACSPVDMADFERTTPLYPIESDEIKSCQDAFRNFKKIFQENGSSEQISGGNAADGTNNNNNNNIIACSTKAKLFQSDKVSEICYEIFYEILVDCAHLIIRKIQQMKILSNSSVQYLDYLFPDYVVLIN